MYWILIRLVTVLSEQYAIIVACSYTCMPLRKKGVMYVCYF